MRIALATDAWEPQVNGVVRTWQSCIAELERGGDEVLVIHPGLFRTFPCPSYPEIRIAWMPGRKVRRMLESFRPDALHIATEGPVGSAARKVALRHGWPFTTSFHTRFPEYVSARTKLPVSWLYPIIRRFHARSNAVLVPTPAVMRDLEDRGFANLVLWNRGVDTELFRPRDVDLGFERPVHVYVGRVAIEKNLEAFLDLDLPGSKVVVGDGPARARLEKRYPGVHFLGAKHGEELARHYAMADLFVFPSLLDTYGLVLLEALACGVPVAAFPVTGPIDVIGSRDVGVLDPDLRRACDRALQIPRERCREFALTRSWAHCARTLRSHLVPIPERLEQTSFARQQPARGSSPS